jgi:hypothetical protein
VTPDYTPSHEPRHSVAIRFRRGISAAGRHLAVIFVPVFYVVFQGFSERRATARAAATVPATDVEILR